MNSGSLEAQFKASAKFALFVFIAGSFISGYLMLRGLSENNAFAKSLCLEKDCILRFFEYIEAASISFSATLTITATIITVIGAYFAILNYISTAKTNAISNHLANLRTFNDFLNQEIENGSRLNKGSIDIFKWYNLIFPSSKYGILAPGDEYRKRLKNLKNIIIQSNKLCSKGDTPSFEYKPHQEKMRDALSSLGIFIDFMPRNDFKEAEGQLLKLIDKANKEFCIGGELEELPKPLYF